MAFTTYRTWVAGEVLTASQLNQQLRDNGNYLLGGGMRITSQAASDLVYAASSTQLARLPKGTGLQFLRMNAGATAPEWASEPTLDPLTLTTAAPATPAADTLYKDSMVKAWVKVSFSGGAPVIDADFNVASLADDGTGLTTVTFATVMASANYAAIVTINEISGNQLVALTHTLATGSVQVRTEDSTGTAANLEFSLLVIGAQ